MSMNFLREMTFDMFAEVRMVAVSNFARVGIDLSLPAHAAERMTDGDNGRDIVKEHLKTAFEIIKKRVQRITPATEETDSEFVNLFTEAMHRPVQVTFRYIIDKDKPTETFLNIPSVLQSVGPDKSKRKDKNNFNHRFKFTVKTVMAKKDFKHYKNDVVINL